MHSVKGYIRNHPLYGPHGKKCKNQMTQKILSAYFLRRMLNLMSSVEWGLTAFPGAQDIFVNIGVRDEYNSFVYDITFSHVPGPEELRKAWATSNMIYGEASPLTLRPHAFKVGAVQGSRRSSFLDQTEEMNVEHSRKVYWKGNMLN